MIKYIFALTFLFSGLVSAKTLKPANNKQLYDSSVRIYNLEQNSGGTGSIFKSYKNATHILTNKHVCRLIEPGGVVRYKERKYKITHYKKFPEHDLCLVRIGTSLNITTKVSDTLARTSQTVYVSGHPNLLPHIATKGHLSDNMDIKLVVGVTECEEGDNSMQCMWFGGNPIVKTFDSKVVSNLIKPGSSGSAVFNNEGEIVGVVFAGDGRDFSHGYIVPHIHVLYFIQNAHRFSWVEVGTPVDDNGIKDRIFNYKICKKILIQDGTKLDRLKKFCESIQDNVIWIKQ